MTSFSRGMLGAALVLALLPATAVGLEETWISGVGDDLNPCTRTAPCKTLPGALPATDDGGAIGVLDPDAALGSVTVDKGVTIDANGVKATSVGPAAGPALTINAPGKDVT